MEAKKRQLIPISDLFKHFASKESSRANAVHICCNEIETIFRLSNSEYSLLAKRKFLAKSPYSNFYKVDLLSGLVRECESDLRIENEHIYIDDICQLHARPEPIIFDVNADDFNRLEGRESIKIILQNLLNLYKYLPLCGNGNLQGGFLLCNGHYQMTGDVHTAIPAFTDPNIPDFAIPRKFIEACKKAKRDAIEIHYYDDPEDEFEFPCFEAVLQNTRILCKRNDFEIPNLLHSSQTEEVSTLDCVTIEVSDLIYALKLMPSFVNKNFNIVKFIFEKDHLELHRLGYYSGNAKNIECNTPANLQGVEVQLFQADVQKILKSIEGDTVKLSYKPGQDYVWFQDELGRAKFAAQLPEDCEVNYETA